MVNLIFAVDFDGTIVDHEYPKIGKLKVNAKEVLKKIKDKGHKIIIWTCRYTKQDLLNMKVFLNLEKISFDSINTNVCRGYTPFPKVYADIYIDDRNIFCEGINWMEIESYLIKRGLL